MFVSHVGERSGTIVDPVPKAPPRATRSGDETWWTERCYQEA